MKRDTISVDIRNLSYTYSDGLKALEDINLKISEGETVALVGPNGAGKSTLLKIIAGLMFPTKGSVKLFGYEVTKKSADELRKKVGLLFQDPDDQIFMPRVWDDVAFGPINQGLNDELVKKRVEVALKQTGLIGFEDRVPQHLSYGEKKKVAIAGIIAMRPKLLLLDEITANLDPKAKEDIQNLIKRLGTTVIMATHDIDSAVRMADKIMVLNRSKLAFGSKRKIFANEGLLKKARLNVPDITKLFIELKRGGYEIDELPLTVEEAKLFLMKKWPTSGHKKKFRN